MEIPSIGTQTGQALVGYIHILDTDLQAHDVWGDGLWSLESSTTPIPTRLQHQLSLLSGPSLTDVEDGWSWKNNPTSLYTSHSAYSWALHEMRGTPIQTQPLCYFGTLKYRRR